MKIQETFKKDITRSIRGVITVGELKSEEELKQELEEYVVTHEILKRMMTFYTNYCKSIDGKTVDIGVWVSGFFGSGKSHFERICAALLDNKLILGKPAIEYFTKDNKISDEVLLANIKRAASVPTDVIQFDIDSRSKVNGKKSRDSIAYIFLKVFNEMQGFCGSIPLVADIERNLTKKGLYDKFKERFKEIFGSTWEESRNEFDYIQDEVVEALSDVGAMSKEAARNTCEKISLEYDMDTEGFAKLVKSYIDSKGGNHHVIFVVDEVGQYIGDNEQIMLNLQTVVQNLGDICQGQAWVMVTSQQDIDSISKMSSKLSDQLSKIQGRFATRLSLSSSNVDEVILKRILEKSEKGFQELCDFYNNNDIENKIKNLIMWNDNISKPVYSSAENFANVYPFVPYQFNMVGAVLTAVRTYGASGKHLSDGERSMLSLFKEATVRLKDEDFGAIVPLHMFYDSLEQFLDHSHSIVISRAYNNEYINPDKEENNFTINVLKTLFLIKYIKEIKPNAFNITSLMVSNIFEERLELQEKVEKALDILVKQTLVSKNGENYIFLTNEEQEINRSIAAINVDLDERTKIISEMIFADIYSEDKYYYPKFNNRYTFSVKLMVDEKIYKKNNDAQMTLRILTPNSDEQTTDENTMRLLSGQDNVVLVVLPTDRSYIDELVGAKQIENYLTSGANGNLDKYEQIRESKKKEIKERRNNAKIYLEEALKNADIYVNGSKIQSTAKDIRSRFNAGLEKLASNMFHKLSYIDSAVNQDDIYSVLNSEYEDITLDSSATNSNINAINDVNEYIKRNSAQKHAKISLKTIIDNFKKAPYGFIDVDVQWIIAKLLKKGDITITLNGDVINLINCSAKDISVYLTRNAYSEKLLIEVRKKPKDSEIKAVKEIMSELFSYSCTSNDEEFIMKDFKKCAEDLKRKLEKIEYNYDNNNRYPGKDVIKEGKVLLNEILQIKYCMEFFKTVKDKSDDLLDFGENFEPVNKFFNGEQKKIFDRTVKVLNIYEESKNYIYNEEIEQLAADMNKIITNPTPYNKIKDLTLMCDKFAELNTDLLENEAIPIKKAIEEAKKRVLNKIEGKLCKPKLIDTILHKFEELNDKAESCNNVSALNGITVEADKVKTRFLNQIDEEESKLLAEKSKETVNSGNDETITPPPKPEKKQKSISIKTINTSLSWHIENEEDVKKYVSELEKKILEQLDENTVINIEF